MPLIAIALVIAAALGGGATVAANNALPGDTLWGFKTTINENIGGAFATTDEAKANWDISVATARLDEAQKLASEGKLDAKVQAAIQENFDAHVKDAATLVAKLQASGKTTVAADVATRLQTSLAQHASAVVETGSNQNTDVQTTIAPFLTSVRGTLDAAANLSASASSEASAREESDTSANDNGVTVKGALRINTDTSGTNSTGSADGSAGANVY